MQKQEQEVERKIKMLEDATQHFIKGTIGLITIGLLNLLIQDNVENEYTKPVMYVVLLFITILVILVWLYYKAITNYISRKLQPHKEIYFTWVDIQKHLITETKELKQDVESIITLYERVNKQDYKYLEAQQTLVLPTDKFFTILALLKEDKQHLTEDQKLEINLMLKNTIREVKVKYKELIVLQAQTKKAEAELETHERQYLIRQRIETLKK